MCWCRFKGWFLRLGSDNVGRLLLICRVGVVVIIDVFGMVLCVVGVGVN